MELEAAKKKYFELYDLAPVGYITLNKDLIIIEANLEASRLLGTNRVYLINSGISRFVPAVSHESLYFHYRRIEMEGEEPAKTFIIKRGDGSEIQVQFVSNLIHNGHVTGFRSILTDVTELNKTKEELQKANNELASSNAELLQFAYIASHDLQEPLRMVVSYLTLLEKRSKDKLDPKSLEYVQYAVEGGQRMRDLINDLLKYSRVDAKRLEPSCVDMNAVVARTLDPLGAMIEESGAEIDVSPLPSITAEMIQMVQVMQNLIGNGIKFHGTERPKIRVSATTGSGEWVFSVKDNGIGLDAQNSERIFQMFQRLHTRDKYPGSGVGLAIAKKIVERHGGRIWVESEEGQGATFFFTIPREGYAPSGNDCSHES